MNSPVQKHRVVIVGGGAGGLELATCLGDTLGRRGHADITLIDKNRTHVWKPKLHEIAAGSMDLSAHEVDYLAPLAVDAREFAEAEAKAMPVRLREVVDLVRAHVHAARGDLVQLGLPHVSAVLVDQRDVRHAALAQRIA